MDRPIRVLCVDDHAFLGEGLQTRLGIEPDMEFVGWVQSAEQLLATVRDATPDIVLLDIEMPGPDPFEALSDLMRAVPDVRVIMLSAYVRDQFVDRAITAGAWGYVSKNDDPDALMEIIRTVHGGEFGLGPEVMERCQITPVRFHSSAPTTKLDLLTPREVQVLAMIGRGMGRNDIAAALHRSPKTIDNHRAAIGEKLGINDRVELARYAIEEGLTDL